MRNLFYFILLTIVALMALYIAKVSHFAAEFWIPPLPVIFPAALIAGLLHAGTASASGAEERDGEAGFAAAREGAKTRAAFLAAISHEIHAPLNAIMNLSEAELRNDLPDGTHANIERIYSSAAALTSLVNDMLDISRMDAGKLAIMPAPYDFANLISDAIHHNVVRLAGKPVKFEPVIDASIPSRMIGDEARLRQIFNNLLSNAFEHTGKGTVTMNVTCETRGGAALMICSVSDTSAGIKPEAMDGLLAGGAEIGGQGLGLFICGKLADMMGGEIQAESEYGRGSTFTVKIPQGIDDPSPIGAERAGSLRTFRLKENPGARSLSYKPMPYGKVLVVDDVVTNLQVARALMSPYKLTVHCLQSGKQAIETVREGKIEYDAIFIDHVMPELDGIETARAIRGEIGTDYARNVPMIALTAGAPSGGGEIFLKNGFQASLQKPIDVLSLDRLLNEWIPDKAGREERAAAPGDAREDMRTLPPISGVAVEEGVLRSGGAGVYAGMLSAFARQAPGLADKLKRFDPANPRDYKTAINGIKSSSLSIFARELASKAEFLERAAHDGDHEAVAANNGDFISSLERVTLDIADALEIYESPARAGRRRPDADTLRRLNAQCKKYDTVAMGKTISELRKFTYEERGELVEWLIEQAGSLEYDKISDRLEKEEAWIWNAEPYEG
jgi:signal transduction histidine kinase/CheY-like chemotaxis protein